MTSTSDTPESENPSITRVSAAVFIAAAFAVSLLLYDRAFSAYDDGIAAEGARLVLKGQVPYRDFWALYAPGSYYVNAFLLSIFGDSFLAIRLALPVLVVFQAGFLFGILRRVVRSRWSAVAAGLGYLAFVPIGITTTNPMTYWLTAVMAGFYCFVRWTEDSRPVWLCASGLLLGVSALFRQDGGVYAVVALSAVVAMASPRLGVRRLASVMQVLGGFAAVGLAVVAFFAAQGALGPMFDDTVKFALTRFPHSRTVPYPTPNAPSMMMGNYYAPRLSAFIYQLFTFWMLPAALLGFGSLSIYRLVRGRPGNREIAVYGLALVGLVLFAMVSVRPVGMRISGSVVLGMVVFAALCTDRGRVVRAAAVLMLTGLLVSYVLYGTAWVRGHRAYGARFLRGIYTGRGYAEMISAVTSYVRAHTKPGEKILSGNPAVYFTTGRDAATKYFEPHPLLTDTPDIQRRIIRDMESHHVRYFVRAQDWDTRSGYFTIEPEHEPRMLIRYIEANYRPVCVIRERGVEFKPIYERKTRW